MPFETRIVSPGNSARTVITSTGESLQVPADWELLPPGDAGLTRRLKAAGPTWTVQEMVRRKKFSRGVWAPAETIANVKAALLAERSTLSYVKKRSADSARREKKQSAYVEDFRGAVIQFLAFAPAYTELASALAEAVTIHATPVGSGTVARTNRIPLSQRAESAVIAWLRHQTTCYDAMQIRRVKGARREVRRQLAAESRHLLEKYRSGIQVDATGCPIQLALRSSCSELKNQPSARIAESA